MRKSKINLAISREDYQKYELFFQRLKIAVAVIAVIFFGVMITVFFILANKNAQNTQLKQQKNSFVTALGSKQGDEAKIFYLQKKYADLETFMKNDASSLPYYSLLNDALKESSKSSAIKSFVIDKSRSASFTIGFNSFPDLLDFFRFIESKEFLKNFESVSLKSFSVIGDDKNQENYEISFFGKFVKL
ncbi:MAG: hypothetical protein ACOYUB_01740 [Patescibacteria group bacterium]